jgi:ferredoxin--NADP+ reductase
VLPATRRLKKVAVIGGGLALQAPNPQAKALHDLGAEVDVIVGFRNTD